MNTVRVVQDASGLRVGTRVAIADSWWTRLRGLLARPELTPDEGLLLMDCPSVHTAGMTYPIDVAFLDADGRVVRSIERLAPWRIGLGGPAAVHTLELAAGRLDATRTEPGTRLSWS